MAVGAVGRSAGGGLRGEGSTSKKLKRPSTGRRAWWLLLLSGANNAIPGGGGGGEDNSVKGDYEGVAKNKLAQV